MSVCNKESDEAVFNVYLSEKYTNAERNRVIWEEESRAIFKMQIWQKKMDSTHSLENVKQIIV